MQTTYEKLSEYIIENHETFNHEDGVFHSWIYKCGNVHIIFQKNFEKQNKMEDDKKFKKKFYKYLLEFQDVSLKTPDRTYLLVDDLNKIIDLHSTLNELAEYGSGECASVLRSVLYEIEANSLNAQLPKKRSDKNKFPKI